jgi:hypothetical protein
MKSYLVLAAFLLAPALASAHYPYSMPDCQQYSKIVFLATKAKENGADPDTIRTATLSTISSLLKIPSFIRDKQDVIYTIESVEIVLRRELPAAEMQDIAYKACVNEKMKAI